MNKPDDWHRRLPGNDRHLVPLPLGSCNVNCICSEGKRRCDCGLCATPLTVVNGTHRTTWFPRRMDLPPLESHAAADEGGTFRGPAPARVPRRARLTVNWWPLAGFLAVIFGLPLCVLAWRTFA